MELDLALDVLIALQYLDKVDVFAAHLYQALLVTNPDVRAKPWL
ncbi:MAG TPA: hypothetical protein VFQ43_02515 [Nitrososphaera sp.]|nr:hypothetical protein [Nitrososphaera sp.]